MERLFLGTGGTWTSGPFPVCVWAEGLAGVWAHLVMSEPPCLPWPPFPGLSFLLSWGVGKAERPRAGDEANSLVKSQQGLGARSASVIHQHDCPLPACVGPERQHILPVPTERDPVGGEGTASTESKKKTWREEAGPLCP